VVGGGPRVVVAVRLRASSPSPTKVPGPENPQAPVSRDAINIHLRPAQVDLNM